MSMGYVTWIFMSTIGFALSMEKITEQEEYEVTIANQIKTNPKLFHAYLKHKKVGRPTIGPLKA